MAQNIDQLKADVAVLEQGNVPGSTNFMKQFELAQKLMQLGENDRAYEVLDGVLTNANATIPMVMSVADAYSRLNQLERLEKALEVLTRLAPDSPEAWYDLAALHATMEQNAPAVDCLKKALELNSSRLAKDSKAQ